MSPVVADGRPARLRAAANRNVVWAADTNYRISLSNDEARTLAEQDDYDQLYAADQVRPLTMRASRLD